MDGLMRNNLTVVNPCMMRFTTSVFPLLLELTWVRVLRS
jgi:hypothetical protein